MFRLSAIESWSPRVEAEYPEVGSVYLAGGSDGAEYFDGFKDGNYEPWLSHWQVDVWSRTAGWATFEKEKV